MYSTKANAVPEPARLYPNPKSRMWYLTPMPCVNARPIPCPMPYPMSCHATPIPKSPRENARPNQEPVDCQGSIPSTHPAPLDFGSVTPLPPPVTPTPTSASIPTTANAPHIARRIINPRLPLRHRHRKPSPAVRLHGLARQELGHLRVPRRRVDGHGLRVRVAVGPLVGEDDDQVALFDADGGGVVVEDLAALRHIAGFARDGVFADGVELLRELVQFRVLVVFAEPEGFAVVRVVGSAEGLVVLFLALVEDGDAAGEERVGYDV